MKLINILIIFYLALICCDNKAPNTQTKSEPAKTVTVTTTSPQIHKWSEELSFSGVVSPKKVNFIYAPVSGKVVSDFQKNGAHINKAEKLLSIKQLQAGDRFQEHHIKSLYSGTILQKKFTQGQYVEAKKELLQICDLNKLQLKIDITSQEKKHLKIGSTLSITTTKKSNKKTSGKVTEISAQADAKFATFSTTIEFENLDFEFHPGSLAFASISVNERKGFTVASSHIHNDDFVWVRDTEGKAQKKKVTIGKTKDNFSEIISKININDNIIISHSKPLQVGSSVIEKKL
jgi:HlyD family secretion protein